MAASSNSQEVRFYDELKNGKLIPIQASEVDVYILNMKAHLEKLRKEQLKDETMAREYRDVVLRNKTLEHRIGQVKDIIAEVQDDIAPLRKLNEEQQLILQPQINDLKQKIKEGENSLKTKQLLFLELEEKTFQKMDTLIGWDNKEEHFRRDLMRQRRDLEERLKAKRKELQLLTEQTPAKG